MKVNASGIWHQMADKCHANHKFLFNKTKSCILAWATWPAWISKLLLILCVWFSGTDYLHTLFAYVQISSVAWFRVDNFLFFCPFSSLILSMSYYLLFQDSYISWMGGSFYLSYFLIVYSLQCLLLFYLSSHIYW